MIFYNVPVLFHSWNHHQHCKIYLSPACSLKCHTKGKYSKSFGFTLSTWVWHDISVTIGELKKIKRHTINSIFLIAKQMFILYQNLSGTLWKSRNHQSIFCPTFECRMQQTHKKYINIVLKPFYHSVKQFISVKNYILSHILYMFMSCR